MRKNIKEIGKILLFTILILFSIPLIGLMFWNISLPDLRIENPFKALYIDTIVWTILLIELPLFYRIIYRRNLLKIPTNHNDKGFIKFLLIGVFSIILFEFSEWILSIIFNGRFAIKNNDFVLIIFLNSIYLVFIRALFEEYFHRVYLTERLENIGASKFLIVILTATIFALGHLGNRYNILGYISLFADGVLYSMVYLKTRNIWYSVGIHFFTNYAMIFLIGYEKYSYYNPGFSSTYPIDLARDIILCLITYFVVIRVDKVLAPTRNKKHRAESAKFKRHNI